MKDLHAGLNKIRVSRYLARFYQLSLRWSEHCTSRTRVEMLSVKKDLTQSSQSPQRSTKFAYLCDLGELCVKKVLSRNASLPVVSGRSLRKLFFGCCNRINDFLRRLEIIRFFLNTDFTDSTDTDGSEKAFNPLPSV